ncbi:HTH-type transcriptional regulator Xre [Lentibacillus sp. JNUCC-1]|uniref:helix-turn-helix domain-containing protein n=1 Tax=Lentibacillus sp. JNUCC-1 TaxID=2654513 RepID=UPI0012E739B3|nr:helix-turn-helix transcriptional regulator [Lentibacillus sp. JNUCC-1]MUV37131.1 HTH-type transcriptional regulator Xre [Lentibacillus sp. JNUCC-1]
MKGLGQRLASLRDSSDYSQKELSALIGYSHNVYGTYEREASTPSVETIEKLADIFHVSTDYLIRGKDYNPNENLPTDMLNLLRLSKLYRKHGFENHAILDYKAWSGLSYKDLQLMDDLFKSVLKSK